ncbi:MAG: LytTR family DNA-binding domain-containing protein [Deltaproteobacteria bacterium]|nr:LytTR family DNA-binding domain-containing protein [Deltaproteobacteria bacterium]
MIKTLIADDESHAIERLKELLGGYDQFQIIAEAKNGTEALEKIVSQKPEVAFLDINMPGVSVFKSISSLQAPPIVIFQTAHSKYAADAFDIDALDYLMKPISRERFARTVFKIMEKFSSAETKTETNKTLEREQSEKITVKDRDSIKIIQVNDVIRICFEEGLSFIYSKEGRFLSDRTLNYYEEKFLGSGFFRSNRANLVNLAYVATIFKGFKGSYCMELNDGTRIEVSRRKALILKKTLDF